MASRASATRPARRISTSSSSRGALFVASTLAVTAFASPAVSAEDAARRAGEVALHRLGYLAADYPRAVAGGKVLSEAEHQEHVALAAELGADARAIVNDTGRGADLPADADAFRERVAAAAPEAEIAARIRVLERAVIGAARLDLASPAPPDRARGQKLFREACAACHGLRGHPAGALVRTMRPPPVDFFDPRVVEPLSPARIGLSIRFGVDGTAMPGFPTLGARDVEALAAVVPTLRHSDRTTPRTPRYAPVELASTTDGALADDLYAAGAEAYELSSMLAEIRGRTAFEPDGAGGPFGEARAALFRAGQRITWGDDVEALALLALAERACRDEVEGAVAPLDPALAVDIEERFLALRARVRLGEPAEALARDVEVIQRALTRAQLVLAGAPPPPPQLGVPEVASTRPDAIWFRAAARAAVMAGAVPFLALAALATRVRPRGPKTLAAATALVVVVIAPAVARWSTIAAALGARGGWAVTSGLVVGAAVLVATAWIASNLARRMSAARLPLGVLGGAVVAAWLAGQIVVALELRGSLIRRTLGFVGAPDLAIYPSAFAIAAEIGAALLTALLLGAALRYRDGRSDRRRGARGSAA